MCALRVLCDAGYTRDDEIVRLVMRWRPIARVAVWTDGFVGMQRYGLFLPTGYQVPETYLSCRDWWR